MATCLALGQHGFDLGIIVIIPAPLRELNLRNRVKAHGVLGNRVGNALCVEHERIVSKVVDGVADLVVVDVVRDARLTAEHLDLLLCLEDFRAREETAGGNAVLDEGGVVGPAAELRGDVAPALRLVVLLEVGLNDVGARGAGDVEGGAVAIVDAELVVGAGNLMRSYVSIAKE